MLFVVGVLVGTAWWYLKGAHDQNLVETNGLDRAGSWQKYRNRASEIDPLIGRE